MSNQDLSLSLRNDLRGEIREVAQALRDGSLDLEAAAQSLDALAEKEEAEIDAEDIDIDFEAGKSIKEGPLFAMLASSGTDKQVSTGDPVDIALLEAIAVRDKISAQRIVGEEISDADQAEYKKSLSRLHDVLSNLDPAQD